MSTRILPRSALQIRRVLAGAVTAGCTAGLLAVSAAPASALSSTAVVSIASSYAGTPYVYGGTTPRGFDCSGFVQYVFSRVGISLPRTAQAQYGATQHIAKANKQPGDLIFMLESGNIGHVGIYAGNNSWWVSPHTGTVVKHQVLYSASYVVGRVPGTSGRVQAIEQAATTPAATNTRPLLRLGSRGSAVALVQHRVGAAADGDFGPVTAAAVRRAQTARHIEADGVVGPLTYRALGL